MLAFLLYPGPTVLALPGLAGATARGDMAECAELEDCGDLTPLPDPTAAAALGLGARAAPDGFLLLLLLLLLAPADGCSPAAAGVAKVLCSILPAAPGDVPGDKIGLVRPELKPAAALPASAALAESVGVPDCDRRREILPLLVRDAGPGVSPALLADTERCFLLVLRLPTAEAGAGGDTGEGPGSDILADLLFVNFLEDPTGEAGEVPPTL